jgi:biofilm regulator BssS
MANPDNIPLFPVAGWAIGPVPTHGIVTLKLDFLTSPMQPPEEATPGRYYALLPEQAIELANKILEAAHRLETIGAVAPPGPQH